MSLLQRSVVAVAISMLLIIGGGFASAADSSGVTVSYTIVETNGIDLTWSEPSTGADGTMVQRFSWSGTGTADRTSVYVEGLPGGTVLEAEPTGTAGEDPGCDAGPARVVSAPSLSLELGCSSGRAAVRYPSVEGSLATFAVGVSSV